LPFSFTAVKARPSDGSVPFAQALGGLAAARLAEGPVEQALAGGNVGRDFVTDHDHVEQTFLSSRRTRAGNQRVVGPPATAGGDGVCQMT
jgi:hypothetical protein